jgi:hypothetical protein
MKTAFVEKSKNNARRLINDWIIAVVFVGICLTACTGKASAVPNLPGNGDGKIITLDLDLTQVVLGPEDVSDLFQGTSYSISQALVSPDSKGVIVTYPTQVLPHTSSFADGFSTQIEIFKTIDLAKKSYASVLSQQTGDILKMDMLGNDSRAFMRAVTTPEGAVLTSTEYAVLFREGNVVASIILRTEGKISSTRMSQLAQLVIDRLQP